MLSPDSTGAHASLAACRQSCQKHANHCELQKRDAQLAFEPSAVPSTFTSGAAHAVSGTSISAKSPFSAHLVMAGWQRHQIPFQKLKLAMQAMICILHQKCVSDWLAGPARLLCR